MEHFVVTTEHNFILAKFFYESDAQSFVRQWKGRIYTIVRVQGPM